jgi:hypothetical protein
MKFILELLVVIFWDNFNSQLLATAANLLITLTRSATKVSAVEQAATLVK